MKHIIDSEALEKLPKHILHDDISHVEVVYVDDLRALIANSPKADDLVKDADTIALEAARAVMDIIIGSFNQPHSQIKAKIQVVIREAIDEAMKGK